MKIFVGSNNPVKINAVVVAASETWPEVKIKGFDVESGIDEQPRSDEETYLGAVNRAKAAIEQASDSGEVLGVGLEGGVFDKGEELWSTVWVAVIDKKGNIFTANGARFKVPEPIAGLIKSGQEMGPTVAELVGEADVRSKQGMIGIITQNFIDRTEEYTGIVKMALGLWYGRHWHDTLSK